MLDTFNPTWLGLGIIALFALHSFVVTPFLALRNVPGPKAFALSRWRLALEDWRGTRTGKIDDLHKQYGPVVRVGPNELSFNSLSALKTIFGAGSGFGRTSFYRMFDVYGKQNLFTFETPKAHGERKKLLNHAYSKSSILKSSAEGVEDRVWEYMQLLEKDSANTSEIFSSLHYFSLDNITHFLYGEHFGGTQALRGSAADRALIRDVMDPSRRKLSWFAVHFPRYTKWLMTRTGFSEKTVAKLGLLPQSKPVVYTGIRQHALHAWNQFSHAVSSDESHADTSSIIGKLWKYHISQTAGGLDDMDIASEAADHLLAGVDTTSDTLMFLIWALSQPQASIFQEKLIAEVKSLDSSMLDSRGIPTVAATDKLTYLDAVIKETLRLYSPLPAAEPRSLPIDTVIDGYKVPANTVVSMAPYSLHRNQAVFKDPLVFNPERWLGDAEEVAEMKKWFWAFSSGGRMCIGLHLAMAEMTSLTAAIYRSYRTGIQAGFEETTPGITSRFEVFSDETMPKMREHICLIDFKKHSQV